MSNKCAACGLRFDHIQRHKLTGVGFHLFPSDPVQRQAWEDFCRAGATTPVIGKFICSDHFVDADYRTGTKQWDPERKRFLRDGAIPSIPEGVSLKKALRRANRKPKRAVKYLRAESQLQPAPPAAIEVPVKLERVCRICESSTALQDLLLEENTELARKFSSLTSAEITPGLQWFCEVCVGRLNDAYDFVQQCNEAEEKRKSVLVVAVVKQEPEDCLDEPMVDIPSEQIKVEELQIDDNDVSGDSASEPDEPKVFTCETCQATFPKRPELHAHFKTHGKSRFPCKLCDKAFRRKCFLAEHVLSHKTEPTFFCQQCPNAYKTKSALNSHVKTAHLGLKPFVCEECGKKFNQRTQLHQHAMVHVKEPQIPCPSCGDTFPTGALYREHMRQHHNASGEDQQQLLPFECDVCSRIFPNKVCLTAHKQVHRERTVLCNVCGKKYRTVAQMKVHMKLSHVTEQLYECERCAERFKTAKSLKFHQNGTCGRRFEVL